MQVHKAPFTDKDLLTNEAGPEISRWDANLYFIGNRDVSILMTDAEVNDLIKFVAMHRGVDNKFTKEAFPDQPNKTFHHFQKGVAYFLVECFGHEVAEDKRERNQRFIEESIELVQSLGCTKEEILQLVDYVYGRPIGNPSQEAGGVMVTLAALCSVWGINMVKAGNTELTRAIDNMPQIRIKQSQKPKF